MTQADDNMNVFRQAWLNQIVAAGEPSLNPATNQTSGPCDVFDWCGGPC